MNARLNIPMLTPDEAANARVFSKVCPSCLGSGQVAPTIATASINQVPAPAFVAPAAAASTTSKLKKEHRMDQPEKSGGALALKGGVPSLAMSETELISVLQSSLYPGAKIESIKLVIGWCRAQNKDPLKRPVHIVPMKVKQPKRDREGKEIANKTEYVWRDTLMPGIGDYRTDAARTGEYAGISAAVFGPTTERTFGGEPKKEWQDDGQGGGGYVDTGKKHDSMKMSVPEWCELSVYRMVGGVKCEWSSGKVYFDEIYATASNETSLPNAMWKKRPRGQLEKCAEAMALRRAFPEVGAQPTADELEGKVIEDHAAIEGTATRLPEPKVEQPKGASEASTATQQTQTQATAGDPPKSDGAPPPPATAGSGTITALTPGQVRLIRTKMQEKALTDKDFKAKFGVDLADGSQLDKSGIFAWIDAFKAN